MLINFNEGTRELISWLNGYINAIESFDGSNSKDHYMGISISEVDSTDDIYILNKMYNELEYVTEEEYYEFSTPKEVPKWMIYLSDAFNRNILKDPVNFKDSSSLNVLKKYLSYKSVDILVCINDEFKFTSVYSVFCQNKKYKGEVIIIKTSSGNIILRMLQAL